MLGNAAKSSSTQQGNIIAGIGDWVNKNITPAVNKAVSSIPGAGLVDTLLGNIKTNTEERKAAEEEQKKRQDLLNTLQPLTSSLKRTSATNQQNDIGQYGRGNIDLWSRPVVYNSDGSISTVRSMSFFDEDEGKEILVPTVIGNKVVSDDDAIQHYYDTGEYLGKFNTPEEATQYAEKLSDSQNKLYNTVQQRVKDGVGPYASEDEIEKRFQDIQTKRQDLMTNIPDEKDRAAYSSWYNQTVEAGLRNQSENPEDWETWKLESRQKQLNAKKEAEDAKLKADPEAVKAERDRLQAEDEAYKDLYRNGLYDSEHERYINGRPEDYDESGVIGYDQESVPLDIYYDRILYDTVHGQGSYYNVYEYGTQEERDRAQDEIEDLWDRMENGNMRELAENEERRARLQELENMTASGGYQSQELDRINKELNARKTAQGYRDRAEGMEAVEADPNLNKGVLNQINPFEDPADASYRYAHLTDDELGMYQGTALAANTVKKVGAAWIPGAMFTDDMAELPAEAFIDPEDREVFDKLYLSGDKAAATAFMESLKETYLNQRRRDYLQQQHEEAAEGALGGLVGLATVPLQLAGGVKATLNNIPRILMGDKDAADPLSVKWQDMNLVQDIRSTRSNVWGKAAANGISTVGDLLGQGADKLESIGAKPIADIVRKGEEILKSEGAQNIASDTGAFLNGMVYSMLDNIESVLAVGGKAGDFSKFAEGMTLASMGTESAANTTLTALNENKDPIEAAILGLGSGIIESVTEIMPTEALMNVDPNALLQAGKSAVRNYLLKNAASEAIEEGVGAIGDRMLDGIVSAAFGHESDAAKRQEEIYQQLMRENPGIDPNVARQQAAQEEFKEFAWDAVKQMASGGLSGGLMAGGSVVNMAYNQYQTGRTIRNAEEVRGKTGTEQLVDAALGMNKDTLSYKIAAELKEAQKNGVPVSDYQIGRLAMNVYNETSQSIGNVARDIVLDQAKASIQALGVKDADAPAAAIAKAVVEGMDSLSKSERAEITGSDAAMTVMQGFLQDRGQQLAAEVKVAQETAKARSIRETVNQLTSGKAIASAASSAVRDSYRKAEIADPAAIMAASGKKSVGVMDALQTGEDGTDRAVTITAINKDGTIQVKTENGTENVDAGDVVAGSAEVAALLRFARTNTGLITNSITDADGKSATDYSYVNAVLQEIAKNGGKQQAQAASFLDDAIKIRMRAFSEGAMPKTNISTEAAQALWTAAKSDFDAMEAQRTAVRTAIKENAGTMTFMGGEYGSKRFEEQIKRHLTKSQQNEARVLGEISKRMGFQVELINDTENTDIFGWEDRGTGKITINMAGDDGNGNRHSIITTAAHEMTHWIEQNSREGYAALREYVFDGLRKQGVDVDGLIMNKMESYAAAGQDVDMGGAIAEIVADSCGEVLGSETMAAELKKVNPNLYSRVKEFVRTFVDRAKEAFNAMRGSSSYEARQLRSQVEELSRIWLGAKAEGIGAGATGYTKDDGTSNDSKNGGTEFSIRQTDDGKKYVYLETDQEMFDNADKDDYPGIVEKYITNKYKGTIIGTENRAYVDRRAAKEYARPANHRIPDDIYEAKARTSTELDNLMDSASFDHHENDDGSHDEAVNGWDYYTATVYVPSADKYYEGTVTIEKVAKGDRFHDFSKLKDVTTAMQGRNASLARSNVSDKNITYKDTKGKSLSIRQKDQAYQQAVESGDTETAQRMVDEAAKKAFSNSKVLDKDGNLLKVYHGTGSDFNEFKREYIGSTGRFEGSGFNFTPYEGRASSYGKNVLAGYLNIQKPLSAERKTISVAKLAQIIREADPTGDNIISDYARETRDYGKDSFVRREAITAARSIWDASDNDVDIYSFISAADSDAEGLISKFEELGYDGLIHYDDEGKIKTAVAFSSNQFKRADPVTYDDNGKPIDLSERFNTKKPDIRYSVKQEGTEIVDRDGNAVAEELPGGVVTAYSIRTVDKTINEGLINTLVKKGYNEKDVKKWVNDVQGIARMIADDKTRLDYKPVGSGMLKNNQEYIKTLDASTLCVKRQLYQGIFNEIQHMLPNTALMPDDLIKLTNMMKQKGLMSPCSLCYVESRRRLLGKYADEWLKTYDGEYMPRIEELTTTDGLEALKEEHPQTYDDFMAAMNAKGSANPKVVQLRGEYSGEIMDMTDNQINKVKEIGGLRVQSFSDFEVVHMLDMMQAVMDMAARELTSQAYTKVPEFAWIFGGTGMKINLSLIGDGTGLDENGNLVFSSTEGMDIGEALRIREQYSQNVGTILVGMNDDHIIAAMGDDRIDFIIPFHKSGWSKKEMALMIGMGTYKDFTRWQNEKKIDHIEKNGKIKTIPNKKSKISNFTPVGPKNGIGKGYWDFDHDGEWNARHYLELCKQDKRVPKFANFLVNNGDGSFSLPEDDSQRSQNIRKGYWKLLIDFKMYDNEGNAAPQTKVQPVFNMEKAQEVLNNYEGGADSLPTNHSLAREFVKQYKEEHPKKSYSVRQNQDGISYAVRNAMDMDVATWMESLSEGQMQTEAEKKLLQDYKALRMKQSLNIKRQSDTQNKISQLENYAKERELTQEEKRMLSALKIKLQNAKDAGADIAEQLYQVTSSEGYAGLMYQQSKVMDDFVTGRTQAQLGESVAKLENEAERIRGEITQAAAELKELADSNEIRRIKANMNGQKLDAVAAGIRKKYNSTISKEELKNELARIRLMQQAGQDITEAVEDLAGRVMDARKSTVKIEGLEALRGTTIRLSESQLREIYGSDSNLKEIRKMLAGSGIRIMKLETANKRTATVDENGIQHGRGNLGSLETNWDELVAQIPSLDHYNGYDTDNALNQMRAVAEYVANTIETQKSLSADEWAGHTADVMADLMLRINTINMDIPRDPAAQRQMLKLNKYIMELAGKAEATAGKLGELYRQTDELISAGKQAAAWTEAMKRDVSVAVDYYQKTAKLAQETAKEQKLRDTIAQLKSEAAQKLAKNNEEWRELIARDKAARETAEDIGSARRKIHTDVSRLYKLLSEPKGLKNIPEHLQGLARELIRIVVDNDLSEMRNKISNVSKKQLEEVRRRLTAWEGQNGPFSLGDLNEDENAPMAIINSDLDEIYRAVEEWNGEIRGKNKADTLAKRHEIIHRMQEAVTEIYSYIRSGQDININRKRIAVEDAADAVREGTGGKKFREWTGKAGRVISGLHKAIVSGNMTPEYFFRNLGNKGLNTLWEGYHEAENRNGLELAKARARLAEIAEKHGYKNWDMNQKIWLPLGNGPVTVTLGQLMSLYATWKRENTLGPEMSQHLYNGGFYVEQDLKEGVLGRTTVPKLAHRVVRDEETGYDEGVRFGQLLTDEQRAFVDDVVGFLSDDMSKLGNEASMKAYGIKMYKEKYYFPFQIWDGVKARKSNEGAAAAGANDRAFHPSFSKSRMHGAGNALVIGDFMQTAADHIAGMINYATMGLANENLQKVLNYTLEDGEPGPGIKTKRNVRAMLEEAYGREAMQYLAELQKQLNGGAVKVERSMYDRLLSMFRKNAVAGSLSVAAQQPLSYIRAAMMISPKYLARALSPDMWKGSYQEMLQHSGVAVIKEMGRFDMNAGQTAREYLMPDAKQTGIQKAWNQITDKMTILPEKMDAMTWTRMWSAVKAEQKALHPEMDVKSDEFLDMCGERFNDLMRRTQVYDSTLVRSENMRSQNQFKKSITSFMAEPTLTLNVLADAVRMAKNGEKGGAAMVAKAGATFIVSAILQAAVKAAFRTGRSPDEKKTWAEQYINALTANMISEMDPMQLIPGYSDLVELLKEGKLQDDAMGIIGKFFTAKDSVTNLLLGDSKDTWRDVEDSVGQIVQLFTNLPAKNLSREARAIYNWATGTKYAQRDTSGAVLKYQALDTVHSADNLLGVINNWLGAAGYETGNKAYYQRIYDARKAGNQAKADEMTEYLVSGRGVKPETINTQMNTLTKADENLSGAEKVKALMDNGYKSPAAYVKDLYSKGELTRNEAEKLYAEANPKAKDKDIHDALDEIDYEQATGREIDNYTNYTPLYDAMDAGDDKAIQKRKAELVDMGYKEKDILSSMKSYIKKQYKEGELTRAEAEAQLKKYDPSIQAKDMAKMLDEIDYEEETGKDVSYSNYTPLFDAINAGKSTDVRIQRFRYRHRDRRIYPETVPERRDHPGTGGEPAVAVQRAEQGRRMVGAGPGGLPEKDREESGQREVLQAV